MVTTNLEKYADRLANLKNLAFGEENKFLHKELGFNFRLSNIACAIGYSQTTQANKLIEERIQVCEKYCDNLSDLNEFIQLPIQRPNFKNVHWMMQIKLKGAAKNKRQLLMNKLSKAGIETREGFIPYTLQEYHKKKFQPEYCTNSSKLAFSTFYLPTYNSISDDEINYVTKNLRIILETVNLND